MSFITVLAIDLMKTYLKITTSVGCVSHSDLAKNIYYESFYNCPQTLRFYRQTYIHILYIYYCNSSLVNSTRGKQRLMTETHSFSQFKTKRRTW